MLPRRKAIAVASALLLSHAGGCGRSSGGSSGESDTFGAIEPHLSGGLNIVVDPFAADGIPNVVVEADSAFSGGIFSGVATVPGVHWAWSTDLPTLVWFSDGSTWQSSTTQKGMALSSGFRMRYVANLNSPWSRGWPAVGGGVGSVAGGTVASSFAFALPNNLETPMRVWFRSNGADVPIFHTGTSCGVNCVDFANWAEAIETPISFARDVASHMNVGADSELPFDVSIKGDVSVSSDWIRTEVESARADLLQVWSFLVSKWGNPAIGNAFRVHLVVANECRNQALEHDASVLVSVGLCQPSTFRRELVAIVAHEMVHVWNARHIFPSETATWDPFAFDSSRLDQLYFYEGATEGFSRIAVAGVLPAYRNAQMSKWNASVSVLAASALGRGLVEISRSSPTLGYEAGAFLSLWLAGKSRASNTNDSVAAQAKFWNIMSSLKNGTAAGVFDIATPLAKRKCVLGKVFLPCSGGAVGYSRDNLLGAINSALGISDWNTFVSAHLGDVFLANQSELNAAVNEIGAAAGISTSSSGGKTVFASDVSAQSGVWPF